MSTIFTIFLALIFLNKKEIIKELKIGKKTAIILLFIFGLGFYLRNSTYAYGFTTDGYVPAESAKLTLEKGLFVKDCAVGNIASCRLYEQVLFPPGYPFLIAVSYLFTGINSLNASIISAILSSLTIIIIFYIARGFFNSNFIGLSAGLIFALSPLILLYANTGNIRPTSIFFIAIALLFYSIALKKDSVRSWALTAVTTSIAIYIRQENSLILVPMLCGLFLFGYFHKKEYKKLEWKNKAIAFGKKIWVPTALFSLTQLPVQSWILFSNYLGPENGFGLNEIIRTCPRILTDFFHPNAFTSMLGFPVLFNPVVSVLFFASIFLLLEKEHRSQLVFFWVLFASFFLISAAYRPCPSGQCTDYIRYMQPLMLPVSIASAVSFSRLNKKARAEKHGNPQSPGLVKKWYFLLGLALVLLFTSSIPFHFSLFKDERMNTPLREALFFDAVKHTPNNCTVLGAHYLIVTSDALPENNRRTMNPFLLNEYTRKMFEKEVMETKCFYIVEDKLLREFWEDQGLLDGFDKKLEYLTGKGSEKVRVFSIKREASRNQ